MMESDEEISEAEMMEMMIFPGNDDPVAEEDRSDDDDEPNEVSLSFEQNITNFYIDMQIRFIKCFSRSSVNENLRAYAKEQVTRQINEETVDYDVRIDGEVEKYRDEIIEFFQKCMVPKTVEESTYGLTMRPITRQGVAQGAVHFIYWSFRRFKTLQELQTRTKAKEVHESFKHYLTETYTLPPKTRIRKFIRTIHAKDQEVAVKKPTAATINKMLASAAHAMRLIGTVSDEIHCQLVTRTASTGVGEYIHRRFGVDKSVVCPVGLGEIEEFIKRVGVKVDDSDESASEHVLQVQIRDLQTVVYMAVCAHTGVRGGDLVADRRVGNTVLLKDVQFKRSDNGGPLEAIISIPGGKEILDVNERHDLVISSTVSGICPVKCLLAFIGLRQAFSVPFHEAVASNVFVIRPDYLNSPLFTRSGRGLTNAIYEFESASKFNESVCIRCADVLQVPKYAVTAKSFRKNFALKTATAMVMHNSWVSMAEIGAFLESLPHWKSSNWKKYLRSYVGDFEHEYASYHDDLVNHPEAPPVFRTTQLLDAIKTSKVPSNVELENQYTELAKKEMKLVAVQKKEIEKKVEVLKSELGQLRSHPNKNEVTGIRVARMKNELAAMNTALQLTTSSTDKSKYQWTQRILHRYLSMSLKAGKWRVKTTGDELPQTTMDLKAIAEDPRNQRFNPMFSLHHQFDPEGAVTRLKICPIDGCDLEFATNDLMKSHFDDHSEEVAKCRSCAYEYNLSSNSRQKKSTKISKHIRDVHHQSAYCSKCETLRTPGGCRTKNGVRVCCRKTCKDNVVEERGQVYLHHVSSTHELCGCFLNRCVTRSKPMDKLMNHNFLVVAALCLYPSQSKVATFEDRKRAFEALYETQFRSSPTSCALRRFESIYSARKL